MSGDTYDTESYRAGVEDERARIVKLLRDRAIHWDNERALESIAGDVRCQVVRDELRRFADELEGR